MPKLPTSTLTFVPEPAVGRPDKLLVRAMQAAKDDHRDEAIRLYRQVLKIDPTNVVAMNGLGASAGRNQRPPTAMQQFQQFRCRIQSLSSQRSGIILESRRRGLG